jgi:hypothetical protein
MAIMYKDGQKIYKLKHHKLRMFLWWLLASIATIGFLLFTFDLLEISSTGIEVFALLVICGVAIFLQLAYMWDVLTNNYLIISQQNIIYHDAIGTLTFHWDNASHIEKDIFGQRLIFIGKPTFTRNPKWAWYWQPDRWPVIGSMRFTQGIYLQSWDDNEDLLKEISGYTPEIFINESSLK